jgi:acetyl esterase/lipase
MKPFAFLLALVMTASADWQPLWPDDAPGANRPPAGSEKAGDRGITGDIEQPLYEVYPAPEGKRTGQAVLIFPGGGYGVLAMDHEGKAYAEWLAKRGITGVVVKYRVSGNPAFGYQFPVPFLDARRAIRTVRANAAKWGVDPHKVGVMGSSAGGHLASLCATRFDDTFPEEGKDAIDKESARPDFAILIYPVVTMGPLTHTGSKFNLLGEHPTPEQIEKYSAEKQVTRDTPPTFLVTTSDDMVDCRNSLMFAEACKDKGVVASLHLFDKGGHGYGLHGQGDVSTWPSLLETWLKH